MCGISGYVCKPNHGVDKHDLINMMMTTSHRGPDSKGYYINNDHSVGLGHNRLSIIDLSCNANQPMYSLDRRFVIVFNGEIYNYLELRRELELRGEVFTSNSDTEILLRLFILYKEKILEKLSGMFAFAIWDNYEEKLFICRDRIGKKPLLYYFNDGLFIFSSELKSFLVLKNINLSINDDAIHLFLSLGYIPSPKTIFDNIFKLDPGHYAVIQNGVIIKERYWFPEENNCDPSDNLEERLDQFNELFTQSVNIRLRSDVPIGLFLSGGIDSTCVALKCKQIGIPIKAYTVKFDKDEEDLHYAQVVSEKLDLNQEIIDVDASDLLNSIYTIYSSYDEPFYDTSAVPMFYISKAIQGKVKVILNGDGGDELFAGYARYENIYIKQYIKKTLCMLRLKDGEYQDPWQVYFLSRSIFNFSDQFKLHNYIPQNLEWFNCVSNNPFLSSFNSKNILKKALYADRHIYLSNDLLYKSDIALMAHSIEGRSPFLDHNLIEWAQNLPNSDLIKGSDKKRILKSYLKSDFNFNFLNRPKYGFGSPIKQWLKNDLKDLVYDCLPCSYFSSNFQEQILNDFYLKENYKIANKIWLLLVFSLWYQSIKK